MVSFGKFEHEFDRPASAAAVFSCLRGGSVEADRAPGEAEQAAIDAWLAEHKAITELPTRPTVAASPTKPGRPALSGPRYLSGDLKPRGPHDATVEKRKLLVGDRAFTKKGALDPRAAFPLGILYLRRAILHGDYRAGMRFAGLYAAVWGKGQIRSHLEAVIYGLRGVGWDDEAKREKRQLELAEDLGQATAALHALPTRRPYHVLVNLAVYERPLRFMDTERARSPAAWAADERDREALTEATARLAELWGIERRPAA